MKTNHSYYVIFMGICKKIGKWIAGIFIVVIFAMTSRYVFFISSKEIEDNKYARQYFEDGTYNADVYYKNKCTGYRNLYELTIEIEGDYLQRIIFDNGGYLDKSKFIVDKLNTGKFIVKNIDGCCEYEIKINYKE